MRLRTTEETLCNVHALRVTNKEQLVDLVVLQKQVLASVEDYLSKCLTTKIYPPRTDKVLREVLGRISQVIESTPLDLQLPTMPSRAASPYSHEPAAR